MELVSFSECDVKHLPCAVCQKGNPTRLPRAWCADCHHPDCVLIFCQNCKQKRFYTPEQAETLMQGVLGRPVDDLPYCKLGGAIVFINHCPRCREDGDSTPHEFMPFSPKFFSLTGGN